MTTRDEMKAMRLKAMGVVGEHMTANVDMFKRVIAAGDKVTEARQKAETAQLGAIQEQVADLLEMAEDMAEFAQAVPTSAASPAASTVKPVTTSGNGTAALQALQNAQPKPADWGDGDAYHGTHPPEAPPPAKP